MRRLLVIVSRDCVTEHGSVENHFADVPCEVIIDRRVGERRRGQAKWLFGERRRGERRTGHLETPDTVVMFVN